MSLIEQYNTAIDRHEIEDDGWQRQVLIPLEELTSALSKAPKKRFFYWNSEPVTGIYLYGSVGVGKTFLMDLFYEQVPIAAKKRFHFHHFMQQVDARLRLLQGQKNPLTRIAAEIAKTTRLLCFDEFMVDDVAHAMILAELLKALFDNGAILVATSNTIPDQLYLNGVHRNRFLPAIAAIKAHCQVISLGEKRDYRLGRVSKLNTYLFPLTPETDKQLSDQFTSLVAQSTSNQSLSVQNREIPYLRCGKQVIWFDFKIICNLGRSQLDYLEIANRFDTVFVSNIPAMGEKDTVFAILLVHFVDVMYDQGIKLIISAAVPIDELYLQGEMSQSFKRTASRLQEMQSADYLQRHPRRISAALTV